MHAQNHGPVERARAAIAAALLVGLTVGATLAQPSHGAEIVPQFDQCTLEVGKEVLKPIGVTMPWRRSYLVGEDRFLVHEDVVERAGLPGKPAVWVARSENGIHLHWLAAGRNVAYLAGYKTDADGRFGGYESPPRLRRLDLGTGQWAADVAIGGVAPAGYETSDVLGLLPTDDGVIVLLGLSTKPREGEEKATAAYELCRFKQGQDKPVWAKQLPCEGGEREYTGGFVWGIPAPDYAGSDLQRLSWLGDRLLVCPEAKQPIRCLNPETGTEIWTNERLWEFDRGFIGPSVWSHYITRFGIEQFDATPAVIAQRRKDFDQQYECALAGGPVAVPLDAHVGGGRRGDDYSTFVAVVKGPAQQWAGYLSDCLLYELGDDGDVISMIKLPRPVQGAAYTVREDGLVWRCQKGSFVKVRPARSKPAFMMSRNDAISEIAWVRSLGYQEPTAWLLTGTAADPVAFGSSHAFCLPDGGYLLREGDSVYHFPIAAVDLSTGVDRTLVLHVPFKGTLAAPAHNYSGGANADGTSSWRAMNYQEMAITVLTVEQQQLEITVATEKQRCGLRFDLRSVLQKADDARAAVDPVQNARERVKGMEGKRLNEALESAAGGRDLPLVKALLEAGADPKWVSENGWTALMSAAASGSAEAVELLIAAGSDVNAADKNCGGQTVLMWAMQRSHGSTRKVAALLRAGADPRRTSEDGGTALMAAAGNGNLEATEYLLRAGMPVSARSREGETALLAAIERGEAMIVSVLLAAGADPNDKDNNGVTALMRAADEHAADIVAALLKAGADPNAKDRDGRTALQIAQAPDHTASEEVVNLLKPVTTAK